MAWRPAEQTMARALAHFAARRYPQAIGAFRATLSLDPTTPQARVGMADALAALGRHDEAVEELVHAAQRSMDEDEPNEAMSLYSKALALDPSRMDLHLDVALAEDAMGRHEAAVCRIEGLAGHYMNDGRTDEAADLLRFAATWGKPEPEPPNEPAAASPHNPGLDMPPVHTALISGHTVIARNPLLPPTPHPLSVPRAAPVASDAVPVPVRSDPVGRVETIAPRPETSPAHDELEMEHEVTVARFASIPIRLEASHEPTPTPRPTSMAVRRSSPRSTLRNDGEPLTRVVPNPVVERLRARAGLSRAACPHGVRIRPTAPLATRPARRPRLDAEDDATVRVRRPRGLPVATL
ncbi:MAG: tetratricopeptide repeat protein [Myxococcota bacterium]